MSSHLFAPSGSSLPEQQAAALAPWARYLVWYQTVVLSIAVGVLYANLPIYGYILNTALLPKYLFFGMFFLMAPLFLIHYRQLGAYLMSPFAVWATLFLVLNLIHLATFAAHTDVGGVAFVDHQAEARRSLITTRAQYIVFALFLGFAAYVSRTKYYLYTVVALMVLVPCAVMLDFIQPGLLYPVDTPGAVLGRAGAMFINPNMAGEAILLIFLLGCAVTQTRFRLALYLLAGAAILATFSRASILAWVLILPILVYGRALPKAAMVTTATVLCIGVIFLGSLETYLHSREEFDGASSNMVSRLNFFSSFNFDDDSSEERADVIKAGWQLFLQDPVFGAGAGATQFWSHRGSTHNQLLLLGAEYGIVGVGLWVWLLIILVKGKYFQERGLQLAIAFLFAFMSLFTHQMFDSASYWLATFAIVSVRKKFY